MYKIDQEILGKQLDEKIDDINLLTETDKSFVYHVVGKQEYILKMSKGPSIEEEFNNQKTIYECWCAEKEHLGFRIPRIYFLSEDGKFYIMEYIQGRNLLAALFKYKKDTNETFREIGECIHQYHNITTKHLLNHRENITEHNTIKQILKNTSKNVKECLDDFQEDMYKIIFKDFTPSNVFLGRNGEIYFLDFQKVHYFAPFYYDLARFIDTTKVFTLVKRPLFFLFNFNKINNALKSFLSGYDPNLDKKCLRKMQYLHRIEHIQMKANKSMFDSIILTIIYWIV